MAIFNSYVCLPEGISFNSMVPGIGFTKIELATTEGLLTLGGLRSLHCSRLSCNPKGDPHWTHHRLLMFIINGHFRNLNCRYLPYIRPFLKAYVKEYPHKIWSYIYIVIYSYIYIYSYVYIYGIVPPRLDPWNSHWYYFKIHFGVYHLEPWAIPTSN